MIGTPGRDGFGTVTPYLIVAGLDDYLRFLETAFGAQETYRARGGRGGCARRRMHPCRYETSSIGRCGTRLR